MSKETPLNGVEPVKTEDDIQREQLGPRGVPGGAASISTSDRSDLIPAQTALNLRLHSSKSLQLSRCPLG
jgi:hypothetical protein